MRCQKRQVVRLVGWNLLPVAPMPKLPDNAVIELPDLPAIKLHRQSLHSVQDWPAAHVLIVLAPGRAKALPVGLPARLGGALKAWLKRRRWTAADLASRPCVLEDGPGRLCSLCVIDAAASAFDRGTAMRKALQPLLDEHPHTLTLAFAQAPGDAVLQDLVYLALVNAVALPNRKSGGAPARLATLHLLAEDALAPLPLQRAEHLAAANTLARSLTVLPPNTLTPAAYRRLVRGLARQSRWKHREFDLEALRRMHAGAFVAVAQGSDPQDAAIVQLSVRPRGARRSLALVGKGICFDTGGHNLKTARHMYGMHEDMNGSAVALASFQALAALGLPLRIDCYLALAQNHLSAAAYKQNDVVTALNGTTIEIVHTDAEGRMVLADTLALASRETPDLIIDYATLTGSMITALGTRQSGLFASRPALEGLARAASARSGERVVAFPAEPDYDVLLDSQVADVKQCLQEGEADHILAARFLSRFAGKGDWLHLDLSSYRNPGGLGAVGSEVNGFGVAWTVALVEDWLAADGG